MINQGIYENSDVNFVTAQRRTYLIQLKKFVAVFCTNVNQFKSLESIVILTSNI